MRYAHHTTHRGHESERRRSAARRERASALRLTIARRSAATEMLAARGQAPAALLQRAHCLLDPRPVE